MRCVLFVPLQATLGALTVDRDEALRRVGEEEARSRDLRAAVAKLQQERILLETGAAHARTAAASANASLENERLRAAMLEQRLVALETGLPEESQGVSVCLGMGGGGCPILHRQSLCFGMLFSSPSHCF